MNQIRISLSFANKTELFNFMQNISNAIQIIADRAETGDADSGDMFSIMELAKIQKQASKQIADLEDFNVHKGPGKNPDFFLTSTGLD